MSQGAKGCRAIRPDPTLAVGPEDREDQNHPT